MKKVYDSLEELMSCCGNSQLIDNVLRVLTPQGHLTWKFISASVEGVISRAEFVSRPPGDDPACRLSWVGSPRGVRGHIEMMYGDRRSLGFQIEAI